MHCNVQTGIQMDKIKIKDLEVYCNHGVFKEENILGQKFLVSVILYLDTGKAGKSDMIEDSISYAEVAHFIKKFMKEHTFKLLEAVAENLAEELLIQYSMVEKLNVEIKKPWAPILLPLDTVSVEIERSWHETFIALGSNLGDKKENILSAINLLNQDKKTKVCEVSTLIETEPMGDVEQDKFLNGVARVHTLRTPWELLELTGKIEESLKRVRVVHWGPRTIDLDIIFYDNLVINTDRLKIPHIGIQERNFVLEPLAEIAPCLVHPLLGKNMYQLLKDLKNQMEVNE